MTTASQVWFHSDYSVKLLNLLYRSCHRRISAIKLPNASHNQDICFLLLDGFLSYAIFLLTRMQLNESTPRIKEVHQENPSEREIFTPFSSPCRFLFKPVFREWTFVVSWSSIVYLVITNTFSSAILKLFKYQYFLSSDEVIPKGLVRTEAADQIDQWFIFPQCQMDEYVKQILWSFRSL